MTTREAISAEYSRRRHEIPFPSELIWEEKPRFTIRTQWLSFVVHFTHEEMVVMAELTLAAKAFVTAEHRKSAVRFIDSIADDLDL